MFQPRRLNNKINNLHEKALRIVCSDYKSTFQELLDKDASFSVHHKNIQTLPIEIYKHIHSFSPATMGEVFKINSTLPCNVRKHNEFFGKKEQHFSNDAFQSYYDLFQVNSLVQS